MKDHYNPLNFLFKSAVLIFLGLISSKILNYIYRIILARWLGPNDYGLLNIIFAIIGILGVFALSGLPEGIENYASRYNTKKDYRKLKGVINNSIKISLSISIVISFLLFIFSRFIGLEIFKSEEVIPLIKLSALGLPFYALSQILFAIMRAFKKTGYFIFMQNILEGIVKIVLTIILIIIGLKTFGAGLAYVLTFVVTFVVGIILIEIKIFKIIRSKIKTINISKKLLKFSLPLVLTGFSISLILWIDTLMLGSIKNETLVGIYNTAVPTARLVTIIFSSFNIIFLPVLSSEMIKGGIDGVSKIYKIITKFIFLFSLPMLVLLIIFSKDILNILFGKEYISGAVPLVIIAVSYFIGGFIDVSMNVLNVIEKTKINMKNALIVILCNLILNYIFITKYGMIGAAIATAISIIIWSILTNLSLYKYTKIKSYSFENIKLILITTFIAIILWIFVKDGKLLSMKSGILILIFLIIYFLFSRIINYISKEDVRLLKDLMYGLKLKITRNNRD